MLNVQCGFGFMLNHIGDRMRKYFIGIPCTYVSIFKIIGQIDNDTSFLIICIEKNHCHTSLCLMISIRNISACILKNFILSMTNKMRCNQIPI